MRTIVVLMAAVAVGMVAGQAQQTAEVSRVIHFASAASESSFQEIATVVHCITDLPVTQNVAENGFTVKGAADQVALAEWLFATLDKSAGEQTPSGTKIEYRVSDSPDDLVRVFYLTNPGSVQSFQEIVTAVRSTADIRRVFTYNALWAVVMRGTSEQAKMAEFLFDEMDKPAIEPSNSQNLHVSTSPEFLLNSPRENVVRVVYLPNASTVQELQQIVTLVRSITYVRRMFTYNGPKAVAMRDDGDKIALAEWLFKRLEEGSQSSSENQHRVSPTSSESIRLFFLPAATTAQGLQDTASRLRGYTSNRNVFTYGDRSAIAIRGTAEEIAKTEDFMRSQ